MPGIPKIEKFRGDNSQSLTQWLQLFEAQLQVLDVDEDNQKQTLLCVFEGKAFTVLSQFMAQNANATYAQVKDELQRRFSGDDYRRSLEVKLRTMKFTKTSDIAKFSSSLLNVVKELYSITDERTAEQIAMNHVMSDLDPSIKDSVQILQLSGNANLDTLLELVKTKLVGESSSLQSFAAAPDRSRIDSLENMIKQMSTQISQLSVKTNRNQNTVCNYCKKRGHKRENCFRLKECHKCKQMGHIAKFCRANSHPSSNATEHDRSEFIDIPESPRFNIKVNIGGNEHEFLYDPGSSYHP